MKVLVVAPFAIMNAVFETDLEIIQSHLDEKDEVVLVRCDAELPACFPNTAHDVALCVHCVSRRQEGLKLLTGDLQQRSLTRLTKEDRDELSMLPRTFADVEALTSFKVEQFDIGWGVLSTLVSSSRDPAPDTIARADVIRRLLVAAATTYRSIQHHIDEIRPDRVYVFNGRFAVTRAVLRAAQSRGVDCFMQERGSSFRHYALYKNRLIHDPAYYQELVRAFWKDADPDEARIMGACFFVEASRGVSHTWTSFTNAQREGELPRGWDPSKNNIVLFASSDDEFVGIGDVWTNPIYVDQYDGIRRIIASLRGTTAAHLYIRLHPNQATMRDTTVVRELLEITEPHVTVISPTSAVSTYALMKNASRVVTFGSTTGMEAVYWGTPSILANVSHYDGLGGTYNARSHDEVIDLMTRSDLPPKSKDAALMFGYFSRSYGIRFRHFQPNGLPGGPFRGVMVRPSVAARLATRALPFKSAVSKVHLRVLESKLYR